MSSETNCLSFLTLTPTFALGGKQYFVQITGKIVIDLDWSLLFSDKTSKKTAFDKFRDQDQSKFNTVIQKNHLSPPLWPQKAAPLPSKS